MNIENYSKTFQKYLQSKVSFRCKNKILKTGKLTLFSIKQYFIRFHIETDKKTIKILELPYPFLVEEQINNTCTLNYKLTSLCNNHTSTVKTLKLVNAKFTNKIYDNIVSIIPLN